MQGGSSGIGYGLKYEARCICNVKANTDHSSFLAGTLSLQEENEVHLIRNSPGGTELVCEGLFSLPNEIWDVASCPFDQRIFSTVHSTGDSYEAAIWKIPESHGELNSSQLEKVTPIGDNVGKIKRILWSPSGRHDKLISIDEENLFLWSLDMPRKEIQVQLHESIGILHYLSGGAWDPHDVNAVVATSESSLLFWDLRTMKKANLIKCSYVRDVDYNPKKQHIIVTAADESGMCIWDLRKPKIPILELPGHTHWTWAVKCNPEYQGLILSSGTDSTVNLWLSFSGEDEFKSERLVDSPTRAKKLEPLLTSYCDYEDSVYGLAWSSLEPWIFASLSYDGRERNVQYKWHTIVGLRISLSFVEGNKNIPKDSYIGSGGILVLHFVTSPSDNVRERNRWSPELESLRGDVYTVGWPA